MTPTMTYHFGQFYREEFIVSYAAVARAITENLDLHRPATALCLFFKDESYAENLSALMNELSDIGQRIVQYSPPCAKNSTPETSEQWYSLLEELIDSASSADQLDLPRDTVPWF